MDLLILMADGAPGKPGKHVYKRKSAYENWKNLWRPFFRGGSEGGKEGNFCSPGEGCKNQEGEIFPLNNENLI